MKIPTPEDEAYVEVLLDEALAGYEQLTTPEQLVVIRTTIRDELLFHPDGQKLVRAARADRGPP